MVDITGRLNVCSTANIEYSWFYIEPFIFKILLLIDYNRLIPRDLLITFYSILVIILFGKFFFFMRSVII